MKKNKEAIGHKPPIAAIATAMGEAGISVIRVSGRGVFDIISSVFRGKSLAGQASHTVHFGRMVEGGRVVDEVLVTLFRSPSSYTGEDTVEISCHGGVLVTQEILELVLRQGVRHANPGEFTLRAFLNGKLELTQAEAVADLIHARSKKAVEAAGQQLEGALGRYVQSFRQQIIDATAMVELELDFVEEDVEFADKERLRQLLEEVGSEIDRLLETYETGRIVRHGVQTVFAGRPNAGKSTLLNTLMGKDRAIVSATAGTTRDLIDAEWSYEGLTFILTDTAGLRETVDDIESEGVRRSESAVSNADLILYLKDLSEPFDPMEKSLLRRIQKSSEGRVLLKVGTKKDRLAEGEANCEECDLIISARTGEGIEELKKRMRSEVLKNRDIDTGGLLVTSSRHRDALIKARHHIDQSIAALKAGLSGDFLSIDLRGALNELGTITGEITTEDLLDSIFSRFCIGK